MHYCKTLPRATLVFFYFDFNDSKKTTFAAMIRSLVTQLLNKCETMPEALVKLWQSHKNNPQGIDTVVLVEAWRELVCSFQDVYVVLDALDESYEHEDVLRFIESLQHWNLPQVHLLVTSRQWTTIEASFETIAHTRICLQDSEMNEDIIMYIEEELANDKVMVKWPSEIREQVRRKLLTGEDGM